MLEEVRAYNTILARRSSPLIKVVRWPDGIGAGAADYAQSVINSQSTHFDILVGLVGSRMGTPTPRANSGTEEEFDRAIDEVYRGHNVQILLFFSDLPVRLGTIDPYQLLLVKAFKERASRLGVLFHTYGSLGELRRRVRLSVRRGYRTAIQQGESLAHSHGQLKKPTTSREHVIRFGPYSLLNKLAPQGADLRELPVGQYRGKDLLVTGRIQVLSAYFRLGFKYSDSREPVVSPGSVQTQGQNLLLHIGRNLRPFVCFLTYYRGGIRLESNRTLRQIDLSKPVAFCLSLQRSGLVSLSLNSSMVFRTFFQLDGIPALTLMAWGDEHRFACRVDRLALRVQL